MRPPIVNLVENFLILQIHSKLYTYKQFSDMLPQDPYMLLSVVNTKLRDEFSDLDDLCASLDVDRSRLEEKLAQAGFTYDKSVNQFR